MKEITIEISGEVASGKSTVLVLIAQTLEAYGYKVKRPASLVGSKCSFTNGFNRETSDNTSIELLEHIKETV